MERVANKGKQYIIFQLNGQYFALPTEQLIQLISLRPITYLPLADEEIKGLINVRGKIVVVIDTRIRFGIPIGMDTMHTSIIIMEQAGTWTGWLVDGIEEVMDIKEENIRPVYLYEAIRGQSIVAGVLVEGNRLISVLKENALTL